MSQKSRKWAIIIGAALLIIIAGSWANKKWGGEKGVYIDVGKSEIRTIHARVTESGIIQPTVDVPVAPDVSGEVVNISIIEGMNVKKGDLLISIQPDDYKALLEQAQASLNQAQSAHLRAQADQEQTHANVLQDSVSLKRTEQLFKDNVVSKVELENAQLRYKVSKSQYQAAKFSVRSAFYQVENARATVKQARQNLDRTNIYASMDGTITELNVEIGQRVVGTRQMAGTDMFKIADLSSMEVVVEINENDIVNVNLGDSAKIEVDAFPGEFFYGTVTEIAYSAQTTGLATTDQVTNFEVKVHISPSSYEQKIAAKDIPQANQSPFRPGMTSLVEIYTQSAQDIVAVPIQAVTLGKSTSKDSAANSSNRDVQEVVYTVKGGQVTEVPVVTGISDDTHIEIRDGLAQDETVVTGPYTVLTKELKNGSQVQIGKDPRKQTRSWGNN